MPRFLITYMPVQDPSAEQVAQLRTRLGEGVTVEAVTPATLALEGEEAAIRAAAAAFPDWTLHREKRLSIAPPNRLRAPRRQP